MTTEIAVMNKHGISLAADSAVTIGRGNKFYNTANKLFMLSKYHPVGIMVYSNADFMGYPIEIIIKEYRKQLNDKHFDDIKGYWDDFVKYLENDFFNDNGIDDLILKIESFIYAVEKEIETKSNDEMNKYLKSTQNDESTNIKEKEEKMIGIAYNCVKDVISSCYTNYSSLNDDQKFCDNYESIKNLIKEKVSEITVNIIGKVEISEQEKMLDLCIMILTKNHHNGPRTGVVVAGFGEKNMFPKLICGEFMGVYFNKLKHIGEIREREINNVDCPSIIIPFAQWDVINTFLTGIDEKIRYGILDTIDKYKLDTCEDKSCIEKLKKDVEKIIDLWSNNNHVNPIMNTLRIAPKEELAQMAETLVNLTSFRKNLSMDVYSQSVGGPIDVALITKGDGFIWIKRKYYFDLNKNKHFYESYFK